MVMLMYPSHAHLQLSPQPQMVLTLPNQIQHFFTGPWKIRLFLEPSILLTEKMLTHVTRCTTSKAAWTTLETLFTSHNKARTMQVHFQLAFLKKGNSTIADYFQKFQALVNALDNREFKSLKIKIEIQMILNDLLSCKFKYIV
jgi:hypothetical protein